MVSNGLKIAADKQQINFVSSSLFKLGNMVICSV